MTTDADRSPYVDAVIVMNSRSGDNKVDRFGLIEKAEQLGAHVLLTSQDRSAAQLARLAVQSGAQRLGAAGGDGTVSAVAAVAAETNRPLIVIPAGTRNHFARDLGLDTKDPGRGMDALVDPDTILVDLGMVESRAFINNVSFGMYADALLEPDYRTAKARSFASVAPLYLQGQRSVNATLDTPTETIESPQMVLVSNNPYHLATIRHLGQRFSLGTGLLGAIIVKRQPDPPPPVLITELRHDLLSSGHAQVPGSGLFVYCATEVTLLGLGERTLMAAIDGEPAELDLPVTCRIWAGALTVHLPKNRPGIPAEPRT